MKKRKWLGMLLLLSLPFTVNAEYKKDFIKTYREEYQSSFYSVEKDSKNGVIAVGTMEYDANSPKSAMSKAVDAVLVRYDENGNILWEKRLGDTYTEEQLYSIKKTKDGNYVTVGVKEPHMENRSAQSLVNLDGYILKINENGEIIWEKKLYGSDQDKFTDVANTKDGGYIAVGTTNSYYIENVTEEEKKPCMV